MGQGNVIHLREEGEDPDYSRHDAVTFGFILPLALYEAIRLTVFVWIMSLLAIWFYEKAFFWGGRDCVNLRLDGWIGFVRRLASSGAPAMRGAQPSPHGEIQRRSRSPCCTGNPAVTSSPCGLFHCACGRVRCLLRGLSAAVYRLAGQGRHVHKASIGSSGQLVRRFLAHRHTITYSLGVQDQFDP